MATEHAQTNPQPRGLAFVVVAWILVCLPLAWGVFMTLKKAAQLFETRV
jgi:hypothetical protein